MTDSSISVASNVQGLKYHVDVCFVVDTTGSMHNLISNVQKNILKFYPDLVSKAEEKGKSVSQLRVKVISFKNYQFDKERAIEESKFFMLSSENQEASEEDELKRFVDHLSAEGGSLDGAQGYRENGLEALTLAINSEWDNGGDKRRHVIVLFSDIEPLSFEEGRKFAGDYYPQGMPQNLDELTDMWDAPQGAVMKNASKRLTMFVPDGEIWSTISNNWNQCIHWPAPAGEGLDTVNYESILDAVLNSI